MENVRARTRDPVEPIPEIRFRFPLLRIYSCNAAERRASRGDTRRRCVGLAIFARGLP